VYTAGAHNSRLSTVLAPTARYVVEFIAIARAMGADPQAVPVGHKDHGGVTVAVAITAGGSHYPLYLGFGEMLAGPQVLVGEPPRGNCSFYDGWRGQLAPRKRR